MNNKEWKYKIGGNLRGLILSLFLLTLFGGLSIWLYKTHNGAYLFTAIFTVCVLAILIAVFYRALFVKVLVYDDGFNYQTKPGKGRYYKYSEIKKAWVGSGKDTTGTNNFFCNCETYDGQEVKFPFFLNESDGVDFLMERVESKNLGAYDQNVDSDREEYQIDGRQYGIAVILISAVILIVFSLINIPMLLREVAADHWFGAFFFASGLLLTLSVVIKLIVRYFFYKVNIENNGFYLRTNPFNGKYYEYTDITSCGEVLSVTRHGRLSKGSNHRSYYYFFIFTDVTGRTRKFLFQKDRYEHEIDVLKERIARCNPDEVTEEMGCGKTVSLKNIISIIGCILIAGVIVLFGYLSKNNLTFPFFKSSQSAVVQTAAPNFYDVHSILYEKGFETANIPTTYWFIDENKLENVCAGVKDDTKFEFYEYTDSETVDLVFNQISYDLSKDMEPDERDQHITELPDGYKIFTYTENGMDYVVMYKENTLIYAYAPQTSSQVQDILIMLGYLEKE